MDRKLYAQFDGDEVDGVKYRLGDEIDLDKHDAGTITYLTETGRIAAGKPSTTITVPVDDEKPIEEMSRTELEQNALAAVHAQIADADDDKLRDTIERGRRAAQDKRDEEAAERDAAQRDAGAGKSDEVGSYDDLKDKPLGSLKTAELEVVAKGEDVNLDDARTNADRVKAIEEARKSKSAE